MEDNYRQHWGPMENEEYNLFLPDSNSSAPIIVENIGITHPNPRYRILRKSTNYFVFEYVISGKGYLETGNRKYALEAGDVYILEPGQPHCYYSDSDEPFEKIWINFFSDFFIDVFRRFNISGINHFPKSDCSAYFEELYNLTKISNRSEDICYQACSILFRIICYIADPIRRNMDISATAATIKKQLDASLYSNIMIKDLENLVHLSKSQLIREFQKHYNATPYNYLLTQKINVAKQLLLTTDLNLQEISNRLAFSDPHYFSRIFKKKVGISPKEFRGRKH